MRDGWTPDRRRADRRRVPFALRATAAGAAAPWDVVEVGVSGIVVESDGPLTVGTPLQLSLDDGTQVISPIDGHVAHCRLLLGAHRGSQPTYLTGITFDRLPQGGRARLDAWLALDAPGGPPTQDRS